METSFDRRKKQCSLAGQFSIKGWLDPHKEKILTWVSITFNCKTFSPPKPWHFLLSVQYSNHRNYFGFIEEDFQTLTSIIRSLNFWTGMSHRLVFLLVPLRNLVLLAEQNSPLLKFSFMEIFQLPNVNTNFLLGLGQQTEPTTVKPWQSYLLLLLSLLSGNETQSPYMAVSPSSQSLQGLIWELGHRTKEGEAAFSFSELHGTDVLQVFLHSSLNLDCCFFTVHVFKMLYSQAFLFF